MPHTSQPRLNYLSITPQLFQKLGDVSERLRKSDLGHRLLALVEIRASQINGCAFCIDMHSKQAKLAGERELRLYALAAWRESPLFDDRERAALRWTEAVTRIDRTSEEESDSAYREVQEHFSEEETVQLTLCLAMINAWNRLAISFRSVPGSLDKMYGLDKAGLN